MNDERATTMRMGTAPGRVPVLGHLLALGLRPLKFLSSLPAHGDLVEIRFGSHRAFVACHPDLMHQILRDGRTFDTGGPFAEQIRLVIGNGMGTASHSDHRRQRRLVQPAFAPGRMPGYAAIMSEQITATMGSWQDGQVLDMSAAMNEITTRVTTKALFTANLPPAEFARAQCAMSGIVDGLFTRMVTPAGLRWLPIPANRRFDASVARLDELLFRIITKYRGEGVDHGDVLSMLVAARDEHGDRLDDREIRDQLMAVLIAGLETVATALQWTLYLVALHPEVARRLHAEVDSVLGGRVAAHADIARLNYAHRVLTESLRLFPPAWMFTRAVTTDTHLAGQTLPTGTPLLLSPYLIHHISDYYPHPDRFDPDRWLPEHPSAPPRGAFVAFGDGAHKCIGDDFGTQEATLALATITARWRLEPIPGVRVRPRPRAILRPHQLRMRLQQRPPADPKIGLGWN